MNFIPPTYTIENFLSKEEIDKICLEIFNNKKYWKKAVDYPASKEKKYKFYCIYKDILKNLIFLLSQFKIDLTDDTSVQSVIDIVRKYCKENNINDRYFSEYINHDNLIFFAVKEILKIISNVEIITDKVIENICDIFFINDNFQFMFGDAIYLISEKTDVIDWEVQNIIRDKFSWVYERIINRFKDIFLEDVKLHPFLPSPGFHIFSLFDFFDEHQIEYGYHEDISILNYHPNIDINTIYSFAFLIKSPDFKPFVEFKDHKMYYGYGNMYLWKGNTTHRIGKTILKSGEYRITFQGHLFFDEKEKVIKMFF